MIGKLNEGMEASCSNEKKLREQNEIGKKE